MENGRSPESRWIGGVEPPQEMLTQSMTVIYEKECREQPERLAQLLSAYKEDKAITAEMEKVRAMSLSPGPVLWIGMGASYCSGIIGSWFLQSGGRSSFAVEASDWLHYSKPVWETSAASILLTTSGESAELVRLCKEGPSNLIALICNNESSTCWSSTPVRLPILAGPEYGNATKTYTNATAGAIVLASHVLGRRWQEDADRALDAYSGALDSIFSRRDELEQFCRGAVNIEVIGRGPADGGAIMGALCIREITGNRAAPHSGGGFRHGPLLDVNQSHVAIILALGRAANLGVDLAKDCLARGGKVILVGTGDGEPSERFLPVKIKPVPEPWEGITSVIVPQSLTLAMAEKYGSKLPPRFQYGVMKE